MTSIITISGYQVLIDSRDKAAVLSRHWRRRTPSRKTMRPYFVCSARLLDGRWVKVALHRLLANAGPGSQVDHKSGDTLDNRRLNLRFATNQQNQQNRHVISSASGFKGVTWQRKSRRWQASIAVDGKRIYLGLFASARDAGAAYDAAALKHFGEFARTNASLGAS